MGGFVRRTFLFLLVLLFSCFIAAEEIQLKDGSKISGTLTGIDGTVFHLKTSYGDIQIPRSEVVLIRFSESDTPKTDQSAGEPPRVDESLDGATYSNRTAHFQLSVPPGWSTAPELRKTKDIVAALKSMDQALFLFVTPEHYSGSLQTYQVLAETQIQSNFQDYEKLSQSPAKVDGRTAMRIVFRAKKGAMVLKFLVYIVPYDGSMVRLSFGTLEPLFNDAAPIFEKMAQSYHSTADKPVARLALPD